MAITEITTVIPATASMGVITNCQVGFLNITPSRNNPLSIRMILADAPAPVTINFPGFTFEDQTEYTFVLQPNALNMTPQQINAIGWHFLALFSKKGNYTFRFVPQELSDGTWIPEPLSAVEVTVNVVDVTEKPKSAFAGTGPLGLSWWVIGGIVVAVVTSAGVGYYLYRRSKKKKREQEYVPLETPSYV
jgi:hypothetical protein